jgi:hypothetical protein
VILFTTQYGDPGAERERRSQCHDAEVARALSVRVERVVALDRRIVAAAAVPPAQPTVTLHDEQEASEQLRVTAFREAVEEIRAVPKTVHP